MNEFTRLVSIVGQDNVNNFKTKTICVIGVGGVGGSTVEALVRSGIEHIILVDFDKIDVTNINRQLVALHSTIGRKKIDVWKERIFDINPAAEVITYDMFLDKDNMEEVFKNKINYLVDACDTISTKKMLIMESIKRSIPFIVSLGTGNKLDPSLLEITDLTNTAYDPLARILRKWVKDERIDTHIQVLSSKEHPVKTGERTPGSSAFVPNGAGLLIASYIIRKLMN